MNKIDYFKVELNYIKDKRIQDACKYMINLLPDYFFEIPASSTGKYHPEFASSKNGLVKHTKVAVRFAYELFNIENINSKYTSVEKDLIIMALLIHDGLKSGIVKETYTKFDHPILIANLVIDNKEHLNLTDEEIDKLTGMLKCHMGGWNTNNYSDVVLPKPKNKLENFVHMCDFLASRKVINVKFNDINISEE